MNFDLKVEYFPQKDLRARLWYSKGIFSKEEHFLLKPERRHYGRSQALRKVLTHIISTWDSLMSSEYKTAHLNAPSASIIQANCADWLSLGRWIESTLARDSFLK